MLTRILKDKTANSKLLDKPCKSRSKLLPEKRSKSISKFRTKLSESKVALTFYAKKPFLFRTCWGKRRHSPGPAASNFQWKTAEWREKSPRIQNHGRLGTSLGPCSSRWFLGFWFLFIDVANYFAKSSNIKINMIIEHISKLQVNVDCNK